jgi:hypothetical protein
VADLSREGLVRIAAEGVCEEEDRSDLTGGEPCRFHQGVAASVVDALLADIAADADAQAGWLQGGAAETAAWDRGDELRCYADRLRALIGEDQR